jgi:hypothetical protein
MAEDYGTFGRGKAYARWVKQGHYSIATKPKAIMMEPFVPPAMHRKRGNPNWGQPLLHIPYAPTEFEVEVRKLGLTKQTWAGSAQLRIWRERNRNQRYVPEWLLKAWGIPVDSIFSG